MIRSKTKRACYNCGQYSHNVANCPHERREEEEEESSYDDSGTPMMRVLTLIAMVCPP
jgi:hypothetical protein